MGTCYYAAVPEEKRLLFLGKCGWLLFDAENDDGVEYPFYPRAYLERFAAEIRAGEADRDPDDAWLPEAILRWSSAERFMLMSERRFHGENGEEVPWYAEGDLNFGLSERNICFGLDREWTMDDSCDFSEELKIPLASQ